MDSETLTNTSKHYTEVLLAVPNKLREDSELDEQIEEPRKLALYCYDEIKDEDVMAARDLRIGIILVYTREYEINKNGRLSAAENVLNENENNYLTKNGRDPRRKGNRDEI